METQEIFLRLGLALSIGLLIGWERGWETREQASGTRPAGVRTFALVAMLGAVSALLVDAVGDAPLAVAFLGVVVLTVVAYQIEGRRLEADRGITTEIALFLTLALGAYVVRGNMAAGFAAAAVVVALLHAKPELHHLIAVINRFELTSGIRLLLISAVLLPLLPDRGYGPGEVLNPYDLWWMVLLISTLSFVGYFAVKYAPRRGLILSSLLGGLASSTAVAVSLSRLAARDRGEAPAAVVGIGLASAMMFLRIVAIAAFFDRTLAVELLVPMLPAALVTAGGAAFRSRGSSSVHEELTGDIRDPSDLWTAFKFVLVLIVILIAAYFVRQRFGVAGVYGVATLAGLVDVDAITVALSRGARDSIVREAAVIALSMAAFTNTLVKIGIAGWLGGASFGKSVAIVLGAGLVVGTAALVVARSLA